VPDPRPTPVPEAIDLASVPRHVAVVMDGNGRWATRRGLPRTEGHGAGEAALVDTVYGALAVGVKALTVFAFSTENWRRPVDEVRYLMNFNKNLLSTWRDEFNAAGVRIVFSGRRNHKVPRGVLKAIEEAEALTARNKVMTLNIAFNYGGRAEIVDAVNELLDEGARSISEKTLRSKLYHPELPDPDLMVRTSGEFRMSNFLLWELAYAELVFLDVLWPDFRREDLYRAIEEYQQRHRRFGGVE